MYGKKVHQAVLASNDVESGATVHLVDENYDRGRILKQRRVQVIYGENPETLSSRVRVAEILLYPEVLRLIQTGVINLDE